MNREQKKFQKRKEREKLAKVKVLRRRSKSRAEAKAEREKAWEERRAQATVNRHTVTVNNKDTPKKSDAEIREQLQKNMQILQALEQEYDGLIKSRQEYADRQNPQDEGNFGGSAGVEFTPFHTEEDRLEYEKKKAEEEKQEQSE